MLMAFISWWYSKGWALKAEKILDSSERSVDYFSLGILVKTWFSPFHQIDAGKFSNASLEIRMRKFFDRSFSRVFGGFLRTLVMLIGIIVISFKVVVGIITLIIWPIVPILPVVFFGLFMSGWTPPIVENIQKMTTQPAKTQEETTTKKTNIFNFGGSKR